MVEAEPKCLHQRVNQRRNELVQQWHDRGARAVDTRLNRVTVERDDHLALSLKVEGLSQEVGDLLLQLRNAERTHVRMELAVGFIDRILGRRLHTAAQTALTLFGLPRGSRRG